MTGETSTQSTFAFFLQTLITSVLQVENHKNEVKDTKLIHRMQEKRFVLQHSWAKLLHRHLQCQPSDCSPSDLNTFILLKRISVCIMQRLKMIFGYFHRFPNTSQDLTYQSLSRCFGIILNRRNWHHQSFVTTDPVALTSCVMKLQQLFGRNCLVLNRVRSERQQLTSEGGQLHHTSVDLVEKDKYLDIYINNRMNQAIRYCIQMGMSRLFPKEAEVFHVCRKIMEIFYLSFVMSAAYLAVAERRRPNKLLSIYIYLTHDPKQSLDRQQSSVYNRLICICCHKDSKSFISHAVTLYNAISLSVSAVDIIIIIISKNPVSVHVILFVNMKHFEWILIKVCRGVD